MERVIKKVFSSNRGKRFRYDIIFRDTHEQPSIFSRVDVISFINHNTPDSLSWKDQKALYCIYTPHTPARFFSLFFSFFLSLRNFPPGLFFVINFIPIALFFHFLGFVTFPRNLNVLRFWSLWKILKIQFALCLEVFPVGVWILLKIVFFLLIFVGLFYAWLIFFFFLWAYFGPCADF